MPLLLLLKVVLVMVLIIKLDMSQVLLVVVVVIIPHMDMAQLLNMYYIKVIMRVVQQPMDLLVDSKQKRSYNMNTYYKKLGLIDGKEQNCILRLPESAFIPFDPANRHYQEYLAWLAKGNTPEPPDYVPAIDQLRSQRDQLLSETDVPWGLADYTHPNKQAWLDYRQALRDITIDANPQLDENGDLTNVIWPDKPEL